MNEGTGPDLREPPAGDVSRSVDALASRTRPVEDFTAVGTRMSHEPEGPDASSKIEPRSRTRPLLSAAWDLLHDVSITVLFCFFIVTFVAQPVRVQGASMQPRIEDNERILVNKFVYRFHGVERGDVVVFYYPRDPSVSYIKRVIGLPGDRVEIRSGSVYVNGATVPEPYLLPEYRDRYDMAETSVERGHYFVMGDHRSSSMDSRSFGSVPEKYIYGKAAFCVWPIAKTGRVR